MQLLPSPRPSLNSDSDHNNNNNNYKNIDYELDESQSSIESNPNSRSGVTAASTPISKKENPLNISDITEEDHNTTINSLTPTDSSFLSASLNNNINNNYNVEITSQENNHHHHRHHLISKTIPKFLKSTFLGPNQDSSYPSSPLSKNDSSDSSSGDGAKTEPPLKAIVSEVKNNLKPASNTNLNHVGGRERASSNKKNAKLFKF